MDVKLEVGMTAIRRDGERVGPVIRNTALLCRGYPFIVNDLSYLESGKYLGEGYNESDDLIAAGSPWATLGAQVGDTVRCVWDGRKRELRSHEFWNAGSGCDAKDDGSLYVIVKRAAKPADRPRAAHKLNLRDGDVVELVGWQSGETDERGSEWTFKERRLRRNSGLGSIAVPSALDKGHRPLFRVVSRAAEQQPDEVIVLHSSDVSAFGRTQVPSDTHRFTITFPAGGDVGTVTREKL